MFIFILFTSSNQLNEAKDDKIHGKPASQAMILFLKSNLFLTAIESHGLLFTQIMYSWKNCE